MHLYEEYHDLLSVMKSRRTPRLVETTNIDETKLQMILDAAALAPSFDKVFPYKIFAVTNSPEGIAKKEALLQYYRCMKPDGTHPKPEESFDGLEMIQPILSGVTLVYCLFPRKSKYMTTGWNETVHVGFKDAAISATYAMLAAESLGFKTGYFGGMFGSNDTDRRAVDIFTTDPGTKICLSLTISNGDVAIDPTLDKVYFDYKDQKPFVYPHKHNKILTSAPVIRI